MSVLAANPNNPVVFFDVTIGGQVGGGSCGPPLYPPSGSLSLGRANHEAAAAHHALRPPCRASSPWVHRRLRDFSRRGGGGWELRWGGGSGAERGGLSWLLSLQEVGRMKIELFADVVPKTAENFR